MQILEQFIEGKTSNKDNCEDSIFISDSFIAVIDGATSKSSRKYNNSNSGKACSELLNKSLKNLPKKISAKQATLYLSNEVLSLYENQEFVDYLEKNSFERASASIIIYSKYRNEIWMIGDCQCLVDNKKYTNTKVIDKLLSSIRSFYIHSEIKLGKSFQSFQEQDLGREFILPLLKKQLLFQNSKERSEFSYGVIDGFEVAENEIKIIDVSKAKEIVLASDGYPKLFNTLVKTEAYLKDIIKKDPLCYKKYKSTKGLQKGNLSFDDRAYIKIRI